MNPVTPGDHALFPPPLPTFTPAPTTGGGGGVVACAFLWDELEPDRARALWSELTTWVDWLRVTYGQQTRIKPCWYRHRAVREELTALMVAHKAAYYTEPDAVATYREDLTSWHTQWYRSSIEAITRLLADCSHDTCHHQPATTATTVIDLEREQFITADIDDHDAETLHHHPPYGPGAKPAGGAVDLGHGHPVADTGGAGFDAYGWGQGPVGGGPPSEYGGEHR